MTFTYGIFLYITAGVVIGYLLSYSFRSNAMLSTDSSSRQHSKSFLLGIGLKFKDISSRDEFYKFLKPYAEWVRKNEYGTLSYEVFQDEKNELNIYFLERYKTKNDYLNVHRKSEEFLKYKANMIALSDKYELNGNGYYQSQYGFV